MPRDWQGLTNLTRGARLTVERVRVADTDVSIEGSFELPPLARLSGEDQVFIMAFVGSHGSIKEMERAFGISYPTVKNRLNRICDQLDLVRIESGPSPSDVLAQLESGEITADQAVERISV